jgi:hypothetical protein|tara:strand:+ start:704 stop:1591 length:888 start_codon:yes stop_codon:yes gene_type:complete
MQDAKIKHSKIRNTGLLFEFLLRQVTADVLNKDNDSIALKIVKEKFNENTELGKELALYNTLINKKYNSDKKADYFITEVIKVRHSFNNPALKREKYNLIKQIKENYNLQKFLSSKVPNYKLYASIYKLFEFNNSLSPDEKTESYFNLVENITTIDKKLNLSDSVGAKLPDDEDLRIITYRTLLEKFNQKYSHLNSHQKNLLRAYINNVSNTNSLKEYINKHLPTIKKEIRSHIKNIDEKIVKIKLREAINSINKFCKVDGKSKNIKDSVVIQTMRYMELLKELKKSANKNKKTL